MWAVNPDNDSLAAVDADTLVELSERLADLGAQPYYLNQLDRVAGAVGDQQHVGGCRDQVETALEHGPADDPEAVVDQYGCAHGVDGLVVADASIMPTVPRANTNLTSFMIGERVGEWIRTSPGRYGL